MRILLVSVPRNYPMGNEMYPSGAPLLLGTMLKKQGHAVRVVHMVADKMGVTGFCKILQDFRPNIVGFTVSTYQTKMTRLLLEKVKEFDADIVTVVGGSHPSALRSEFLTAFPNTDIVVYGEGEKAITDITQGTRLSHVKGICFRENGKVITTESSPLIPDLDILPFPDKSLISFERYSGLFPVGRRPCMFIMSSRGCPYRCSFCSKAVYGSALRLRSPENIMDEVELLYREWGVREIHFGDDTFNANRKWATDLLNLIIKGGWHKKLIFRVALRVNENILDLDLLNHLKAAGVWFVMFGVESGNQGMLDRMHKGITVDEVRRAFQLTHSVGIKTEAYFVIGLPGETAYTVLDSYNLYKEIKPYWAGFSRAMPFPGTEFTREVKAAGHLLHENYDEFSPSCMAVRTEAMSANELDIQVDLLNRMATWDKVKHVRQLAYAIGDKTHRR